MFGLQQRDVQRGWAVDTERELWRLWGEARGVAAPGARALAVGAFVRDPVSILAWPDPSMPGLVSEPSSDEESDPASTTQSEEGLPPPRPRRPPPLPPAFRTAVAAGLHAEHLLRWATFPVDDEAGVVPRQSQSHRAREAALRELLGDGDRLPEGRGTDWDGGNHHPILGLSPAVRQSLLRRGGLRAIHRSPLTPQTPTTPTGLITSPDDVD